MRVQERLRHGTDRNAQVVRSLPNHVQRLREMGRRPKIGDPRSGGVSGAGRDHWTSCMSVLMAGGGIRGGQVYGSSDRFAEYPADKPVAPEDIARTVFHAMGIDDLTAHDRQGRPFALMEDGRPLYELFG